ncbi:MAG: amidohydrolase family protein [Gammaproteobacteria bacterium]
MSVKSRERLWMFKKASRRSFVSAGCAVLGVAVMPRAFALDNKVDLILKNGKIATVDANNSFATTVVVKDGRIVAVGDASVAEGYQAARVIDLAGKTVLPGLCDNHVHPSPPKPLAPGEVDLQHAYTWAENEKLLKAALKGLPAGAWLRASAFRLYFTEVEPPTVWISADISKIPTRYMLDKVAPNNPVIVRASQLVVANSLALKLAGITRNSPQPTAGDGKIEKDANGEPTGILWYASGDAIEDFAPPLPPIPRLSARQEYLRSKTSSSTCGTWGSPVVTTQPARRSTCACTRTFTRNFPESCLASPQDQNDIENLQQMYGYYIDKGKWEQAANLFAGSATLEIQGRGAYVGGSACSNTCAPPGRKVRRKADCSTTCSCSRSSTSPRMAAAPRAGGVCLRSWRNTEVSRMGRRRLRERVREGRRPVENLETASLSHVVHAL